MKISVHLRVLIIFLINSSMNGINSLKKIKVDKAISRGFFRINKRSYSVSQQDQKKENPLLSKEMPVQHNSTNPDDKTRFNLIKKPYNSPIKSINFQEKAPLLSRGTEFMSARLKLQQPKKSPTIQQVRDTINRFSHSHLIKRYIDSEGRLWEESFGFDGKKLTQPVFYENGILRARNYTVGERLKKTFGYDNQVKVDPRALEKSYDELRTKSIPKVKSADTTNSTANS